MTSIMLTANMMLSEINRQVKPLVSKLMTNIIIPAVINEIPPNRWLFFQTASFFMLHFVLKPIIEFNRVLGIMFPMIIIKMPIIAKIS